MSFLVELLERAGLDATEAEVYLTTLKLGTQRATTIAKQVGQSRYVTLTVLTKLVRRGLVHKCKRDQIFFTAEAPEVVMSILKEKNPHNPEIPVAFKKAFPLFAKYRSPHSTRPEMSFFEGKEGLIAAYEDTLTSRTEILAFASISDTERILPRYVPRYYKRRKAAGILIKAIFPDTPEAHARQKKDNQELRISRLIPAERYHFRIEINIYDDKVAYFSLEEELAVIIKSADIAESMKHMFTFCWEMAGG